MTVATPDRGALDTIEYSVITAALIQQYNVDLIFYYIDGAYSITTAELANLQALQQQFPGLQLVSLTVMASPTAQGYDCEAGNGTPTDAVTFAQGRQTNGEESALIYCGQNTWWAQIQTLINAANLTIPTPYWVANYDGDPAIPAGAAGKQYADSKMAGVNVDVSNFVPYVPGIDTSPGDDDLTPEQAQQLQAVYDWLAGTGNAMSGKVDALYAWDAGTGNTIAADVKSLLPPPTPTPPEAS